MMRVNLEKTVDGLMKGASEALKVIVPALEIYVVAKWLGYIPERKKTRLAKDVTPSYEEAVKSIVNESNMLDSSINECLVELKSNGTKNYYSAVISIAESNMLDSSKVKAITSLNENQVEAQS